MPDRRRNVDPNRDYPILNGRTTSRVPIGTGRVESLDASYFVTPGFNLDGIGFDPSQVEFSGVWIGSGSNAVELDRIVLSVKG